MADESGGIGLFVYQDDAGAYPEEPLIGKIAKAQVLPVHLSRHQGADQLGIAACYQFALPRAEFPQFSHPARVDGCHTLQGIAGDLDAKGKLQLPRQAEQRPIAAADHLGAQLLLNRGKGQVQVEYGVEGKHESDVPSSCKQGGCHLFCGGSFCRVGGCLAYGFS